MLYIIHLFLFYRVSHYSRKYIFYIFIACLWLFWTFGSNYVLFLVMVFNNFISFSWPYFKPKKKEKLMSYNIFGFNFCLLWFEAMLENNIVNGIANFCCYEFPQSFLKIYVFGVIYIFLILILDYILIIYWDFIFLFIFQNLEFSD